MAPNRWLKLTIETDPVLIESISDFLVGVIEAGVETGAPDEPHYGTLSCYVPQANPAPDEVAAIVARVSAYLDEMAKVFGVSNPTLSPSLIDEEDWSTSWKTHFKPFVIVPGLVIAPTWEEYRPVAGEAVITMDPGMAFGTGHHPTTCLSLELLRRTLTDGTTGRVLDVGTGTGILGMAALLFGAAAALGVDNDPVAVAAATDNVRQNRLEGRMQVSQTPIGALTGPYEIVVANIVHDVLVEMAGDLTRLTGPGGTLILSGVLTGDQAENIGRIFTARGFTLLDLAERQEWAALRLCRG
jgi:ribosomal protein L11 methyltransferase